MEQDGNIYPPHKWSEYGEEVNEEVDNSFTDYYGEDWDYDEFDEDVFYDDDESLEVVKTMDENGNWL
jgi:hypothetical protein